MDGVFNYTSLLLSQEDDMLYVGAREALFALSLSDISRAKLQKNVSSGLLEGLLSHNPKYSLLNTFAATSEVTLLISRPQPCAFCTF